MIRVVLADDHGVIRDGLGRLISALEDVELVGVAADGDEAVERCRETMPDVVLMDLDMPVLDGIQATRRVLAERPETAVIVLTAFSDRPRITGALEAGACGYLLKDSSIQDLMQGIRAASVGEALISPHIAAKVLQRIRGSGVDPDTAARGPELSGRETEVLRLIANGKDNAEIAGELHISPKTVKNHISNILMKLQIENRIQAAVYAVRRGLV